MPLAFITGGAKRMGRGIALGFADKGWDISFIYNSSQNKAAETVEEIRAKGVKAFKYQADVRDYGQLKKAFNETAKHIGIPNVLVNNSGVFPPPTPIDEIDNEMWDDVLNINLRGEYFASKIFAEIAEENARIINIASLGGLQIWKNRIPYNVSKAGVIQLTKALARDLAPRVSVNCIAPGAIMFPGEEAPESSNIPESKIPMGRFGNINDIFSAVYFLAAGSQYITGQLIAVDGGFHNAR